MNSTWIKDINIRPETIKLLEENTAEKLLDTGLGSSFPDLTPKTQARKTKTNWWGYIRLKRGGKNTQKNYTKKVLMTQITMMVWSLT